MKKLLFLAIVVLTYTGLAWEGEDYISEETLRYPKKHGNSYKALIEEYIKSNRMIQGSVEEMEVSVQPVNSDKKQATFQWAVDTRKSPTQVTAYKASDGKLFETGAAAERHTRKVSIKNLWSDGYYRNGQLSMFIIDKWPEIKAIMQDPTEKQTGLTPEKKRAFIDFYYKCLENGGETVFTIMFDNWSEFKAIIEGEK